MFLENRIGSLEPGKDADIAVWDRNMYAIPSAELKNIQCELTLFRGQVVYALDRLGRPPRNTNFWIFPVAVFGSSLTK